MFLQPLCNCSSIILLAVIVGVNITVTFSQPKYEGARLQEHSMFVGSGLTLHNLLT